MSMFKLLELLQQDIIEIKRLVNYDKYGLTLKQMKKLAKEIIRDLENHLEEYIELNNNKSGIA